MIPAVVRKPKILCFRMPGKTYRVSYAVLNNIRAGAGIVNIQPGNGAVHRLEGSQILHGAPTGTYNLSSGPKAIYSSRGAHQLGTCRTPLPAWADLPTWPRYRQTEEYDSLPQHTGRRF